MVTFPGSEIPVGKPAEAPRYKRQWGNDLAFSLEQSGVREPQLKSTVNAQIVRVRKFIDLYKGVSRLPVYEQCGVINRDVVAVEQKIKDVQAKLAPTEELAKYFLSFWNRKEYYRLSSILFLQLHLVSAIGTVSAWCRRPDESKLPESESKKNLDSLFLKLESWLDVEEALLKGWR